jgi:hypothetical protein
MKLNATGNSIDRMNNITNLLSNDASRLNEFAYHTVMIIVSPLIIMSAIIVLVSQVNYSMLSGLLLLILVIPIQTSLNSFLIKLRYMTADFVAYCKSLFSSEKIFFCKHCSL